MTVLWRERRATVRVVAEALPREHRVAYNTVQTMLGVLEKKGYVAREREGRAFSYRPLVSRAGARAEALRHVLGSFFAGSRQELVHSLLDEQISEAELSDLRTLLDRAEAEISSGSEGDGASTGDPENRGRSRADRKRTSS